MQGDGEGMAGGGDVAESPSAQRVWWMRAPLWLALAVAALAVPLVLVMHQNPPGGPALPKLGHVAPFSLVRESGQRLTQADLEGQVWVADFIFLGCTESCPLLSSRMSHLQRTLLEEEQKQGAPLGVQLVSFSVDPSSDSPERLAEYAARWHADPRRWTFATGSTKEIQHVVADGFKIAYGKVDDGAGAFEIMHGNWFVLVDGEGRIRGYYSSDRQEEMAALVKDMLSLSRLARVDSRQAALQPRANP